MQAVYNLKDYIVHTHAKDGRRNYYRAPEEVYGLVEAEMLASPSFTELPLGTGNVDFAAYLKALDEIGYHGFLTVEREVGDTPEKENTPVTYSETVRIMAVREACLKASRQPGIWIEV